MIAAGGTGGHVYPALAIAEALREQHADVKLAFVGGVGGFERPLLDESGVTFDSYDEVRAGPLHSVGAWRMAVSLVQLALGFFQAVSVVLRRKPQALLLTGGWNGVPTALAAWLLRVPMMIYLPDIEPGLTIKALQRFASLIALTTAESAQYFPNKRTVVTGYPLRRQMREATRPMGIRQFGLEATRQTLLVFGGSRGSRAINNALLAALPALLHEGVQVIHVTGTLDWEDIRARRDALPDATHYHAYPYLHHEMGMAMACADVVVSRSGASILGEFPYFGLPSLLIPLAYMWRYQKVNADYLAERGAALVLDEKDMQAALLPTLRDLLADAARLSAMRTAAQALAQVNGAGQAATALVNLARGSA